MDHELTRKIQAWVESPAPARSVPDGALLLLQLNRNQWLYRSACISPNLYNELIENELRKYLRIRLDGLTQAEVARLEPVVKEAAHGSLEAHAARYEGKRDDHDSLPADIRALYERNGELYKKMKQTYNHLLTMEGDTPCDRYEYIQVLRRLDDEYRANWERYDHYTPAAEDAAEDAAEAPQTMSPAEAAKAISAARRYLSTGLTALADPATDADRAGAILIEMQERASLIRSLGGSFKPAQEARLRELGIDL